MARSQTFKGNVQGFRLEYMESIFPTYIEHVREGTTTPYWAVPEAGYWARFDWRHSDLKEEAYLTKMHSEMHLFCRTWMENYQQKKSRRRLR
jgi:hypothetical protein